MRNWVKISRESLRAFSTAPSLPSSVIYPGTFKDNESYETTHFSIVDKYGNAVSSTYTLNSTFGSGVVIKNTGILMNNEMDDFAAAPGIANQFGLLGAEANQIVPGKRPLSSMTPTNLARGIRRYCLE